MTYHKPVVARNVNGGHYHAQSPAARAISARLGGGLFRGTMHGGAELIPDHGMFRGNAGGGDGRGMFWSGARVQVGLLGSYIGDVPQLVAYDLGSYGGGLGDDAKKAALARSKFESIARSRVQAVQALPRPRPGVPGTSIKNGKVVVKTASLWSNWNAEAAKLFRPFAGAIDVMPIPADWKRDMKNAPLDALLNIFDPIEDRIGRAVDRVLAKKGNVQNYFGRNMNLQRVQPIDRMADASTQNLMRSLRTITAFIVLFFAQPIDLGIEMVKEGINIAGDAAKVAGDMAASVARAAGDTAAAVLKAASDATHEVASWLGLGGLGGYGLGGYGGLGVTGADDAAGAAAAATPPSVGAAAIPGLDAIISSIVTALVGALGTVGVNLVKDAPGMITGMLKPQDAPPTEPPPGPPLPPVTEESGIPTTAILVGGAVLVGAALLFMRKKS